ncbi:MAG TPA: hypothetical protein VGO93_30700 [Candidatus Xenobia bacterium]|jgi:hypothetical protein
MRKMILVLLMLAGSAWGKPPTGQVDGPSSLIKGAFQATMNTAPHRNDVFNIIHAGRICGQAVVITVTGNHVMMVKRLHFQGDPEKGDQAVFAGHDTPARGVSRPADPADPPSSRPPSPPHKPLLHT